jgi:hypothetical protein
MERVSTVSLSTGEPEHIKPEHIKPEHNPEPHEHQHEQSRKRKHSKSENSPAPREYEREREPSWKRQRRTSVPAGRPTCARCDRSYDSTLNEQENQGFCRWHVGAETSLL